MGLLRKIAYAFLTMFLALFLMLLVLGIVVTLLHEHGPTLVSNQPVGLQYEGPPTTAIAGYYCVEYINSSGGYSIQLNTELSNGYWLQDTTGTTSCTGDCLNHAWSYQAKAWASKETGNETVVETVWGSAITAQGPMPCGWLVIAIINGTAYFGYSLNGSNVQWFSEYPVGNATIVGSSWTQLVLAGPASGEGIKLNTTLTLLALYYWNGTTWKPAPVGVTQLGSGWELAGWVSEAWVYTAGSGCGMVSWPKPTNETTCPPTPTLKPKPGPILVTKSPGGLQYDGPPTTALAGYYCVKGINYTVIQKTPSGKPVTEYAVPVGYSIQLNAEFSNGVWLQDVMGVAETCNGTCPGGHYLWGFAAEAWVSNGSIIQSVWASSTDTGGPVPCGWLVMAVRNGTAYLGYSLDGSHVVWYGTYPVGNVTIVNGSGTQLVLAGPSSGEGIELNRTLTLLALYYWNGTTWEPAPVEVVQFGLIYMGTEEWVSKAWVYTTGRGCGVVSWPEPINTTECPPPPSFRP